MESFYFLNNDCISCFSFSNLNLHFSVFGSSKALTKFIYTISEIYFSCQQYRVLWILHKFQNLTHLQISKNPQHFCGIKCMDISNFHGQLRNYLSTYNYEPPLKSLRIDIAFKNISPFLNLERLHISPNVIDIENLNQFNRLTYLKFIVFHPDTLIKLTFLSNLKVLHIEGEEYLTQESFMRNHRMHVYFTNLLKLSINMRDYEHQNSVSIDINFPNLTYLRLNIIRHCWFNMSVNLTCSNLIKLYAANLTIQNANDYFKTTRNLTKLCLNKVTYNGNLILSGNYLYMLTYLKLVGLENITLDKLKSKTNILNNIENCIIHNS